MGATTDDPTACHGLTPIMPGRASWLGSLSWSTVFPHRAELPAQRGGTWHLTVQPREGWRSYQWHVAHSVEAGLTRNGSASTVNFAKGQAEQAAAELDTGFDESLSGPAGE